MPGFMSAPSMPALAISRVVLAERLARPSRGVLSKSAGWDEQQGEQGEEGDDDGLHVYS